MRIIADENISGTVILRLREAGHYVVSAKESLRGANDIEILRRAQSELLLVITNDKDFGELAFRYRLPSGCGIVLFRMSGTLPEVNNQRILDALNSRTDFPGHFSVVDDWRIRTRPLSGVR